MTWARAGVLGAWALSCAVEPPIDDRVIRLGADVDAETLDPRLMRNTTAYRVVNLLYDGLVELDASLTPQPSLAVRWETPTPTEWIFHLRPGVRFHDGSELSASDVVFTLESILDPATQARFRALYEPIVAVVAQDSATVRIELDRPYAPLLGYLDVGILSRAHVAGGGDPSGAPVGTGPMRLARWDRGSRLVLEAFPDHWAGPPAVDGLEFVVVGDNTARAQAFEAGDLDVIQSPLSPQDVVRLDSDSRFVGHSIPGVAITYLNFNTAVQQLADPAVRRALAMLVDAEAIVSGIYEGVDEPGRSVLLPSSWAYTDDVAQPGFDPAAGRALLDSAGWSDSDGDGVLDRGGEPFAVELSTHSEDPNRIQALEYIQASFRENGIDASVSISDWPAFLARVQEGRHQIALLGWTNLVDPDRLLFAQLVTGGDLNYGGYANPALDGVLGRGRSSTDRTGRVDAYREAARIVADEVPWYVVSYQAYQVFHDVGLGLEPDPRGMMRSVLDR